jgi:hypothetical protein
MMGDASPHSNRRFCGRDFSDTSNRLNNGMEPFEQCHGRAGPSRNGGLPKHKNLQQLAKMLQATFCETN